jgi:hypothetical protein
MWVTWLSLFWIAIHPLALSSSKPASTPGGQSLHLMDGGSPLPPPKP